jgi:hypothetical protein
VQCVRQGLIQGILQAAPVQEASTSPSLSMPAGEVDCTSHTGQTLPAV